MKLIAYKNQLQEAPDMWLRRAGYTYLPARGEGEKSFARRLTRDFYPRFHIYYNEVKDKEGKEGIIFNLHLDQKKPGYAGYNRHNAEYEGDLVENEIRRLKTLLLPDFFQ
jgi:hypothetical protein